ncbi:hypothetical protein [Dickeya oryzae]
MIVNNRIGIADQLAPDYQITLTDASGNPQTTRNLSQRLISLSLHDVLGFESDQLSLDIDDSDGKVLMPKRGEKVSVKIGWKGKALEDKGTFVVDQVSHSGAPDRITLSARSVNFRGDLNTPRDGSYNATTLGDIARTIAERYSLLASIDTSLANTAIVHENQSKESDLSFLCRLARKYSGTVAIKKRYVATLCRRQWYGGRWQKCRDVSDRTQRRRLSQFYDCRSHCQYRDHRQLA